MRILVSLVAMGLGLAVVAGFCGAWHPVGDSLAVFRLPLAAGFAPVVIWSAWPKGLRWGGAGLALLVMGQVAYPSLFLRSPEGRHTFTLYQQNLLFNRKSDAQYLENVVQSAPDVITLQEVSTRNMAVLDALKERYPTQHVCPFAAVGGVAVLSRFPAVAGRAICAQGDGLAALQLDTPHGRIWVVSLHLHWPWPYGQAVQVDRVLPVLATLDGPVILAGDFNAVPWSHSVRRIAQAIDGARISHGGATFHLPHIAIPVTIDHVLTNVTGPHWEGSMPKAGSDHHGILSFLTLPTP